MQVVTLNVPRLNKDPQNESFVFAADMRIRALEDLRETKEFANDEYIGGIDNLLNDIQTTTIK